MRRLLAALAPALVVLASTAAVAEAAVLSATTKTTLRPDVDTYVDASLPKRSFGTAKRLKVSASPALRSYVRFDAGGVSGVVRRATLRLWVAVGDPYGADVRAVADHGWAETINHRTAPAISPDVAATTGPLTAKTWVTVDVTPLVQGSGPVSLALTPGAGTGTAELASRESGSAAPQLVVESEPPPADVTAPQVAITGPADGATVAGTVDVAADALDDGRVTAVEFLVDGSTIGTDTEAPYSVAWNTATVADGLRALTARATDAAGNVATSEPRTVTVANAPADTTPPDTSVAQGPADTHRSGIARFAFAATEAGATFECRLDEAAYRPCAPDEVLHVANGRHELRVRATDPAGNVDPTPATRTWWADAILQNGTFETDPRGWTEYGFSVPGWKGYLSDVAVVPGGASGMKARVTPKPGESFYSVYDAPRSVDATVAGRAYTARGLVRSDSSGRSVCLEVVERSPAQIVGRASRCVTATGSWQPFPEVALTARGGNNLYVVVSQDGAAAGASFEIDGMELLDGSTLQLAPPAEPPGDPRLLAFGDIGFCDSAGDEAVARLVDTLPGTIAMLGDLEQRNGSAAEFAGCFTPSWSRHMARARPAVGDHEYRQPGALPYWDAVGGRGGEPGKGWYSYDLGSWHIVVLNSNCGAVGGCEPGSEQHAWLERDLAANATSCIGAYFHHPRFSSGNVHGSIDRVRPFWDVLYRYGAEWVLGGNDHNYQRFAPQTPAGIRDDARGIRQFVVGTGGAMHYANGPALPNTEVQHSGTFGALELTLGASGYDWRFVPQEGRSFTDTGSQSCSQPPATDTTPPSVRLTDPAAGATITGTARVAAEATDDDGVDQVEFRAGERVLATDTSAPYGADVDTTVLAPGQHVLTAVARDRSGNVATSEPVTVTVAQAPPPANLVPNASFETGLSGWSGYRGTLSRVTGGADGEYALRATFGGTGTSYSAITTPVSTTASGTAYEATAWFRSVGSARRICLRIRETGPAGVLGAAARCATSSTSWQAFAAIPYTAVGGGKLEVYAYEDAPAAGASFDLDDVRLLAR